MNKHDIGNKMQMNRYKTALSIVPKLLQCWHFRVKTAILYSCKFCPKIFFLFHVFDIINGSPACCGKFDGKMRLASVNIKVFYILTIFKI